MALTEKLTAIADAVRSMSGKSEKLTLDQMPLEISQLQSLNFTVVGGTAQPSQAGENTIWVNTGTAITGYVFSATQPESPEAGMVWFAVSDSSSASFSATKQNPVMVYPICAKQYVSGAWVDREAQIHQGGGWTDLAVDVCLYNTGDECNTITGGWSQTSNGGNKPMSLSKGGSYLNITASWSGNYTSHSTISTAKTVDVSKHTKLNVLYDFSASAGTFVGAGTPFQDLNIGLGTSNTSLSSYVSATRGTNQRLTLDISAQNGSFYVVIQSANYCTSGNVNIKIHKVWLS